MRRFNTSGPNISAKHYTLPRLEIVEEGVNKIRDERYFTIPSSDGTGKSTYFRLLADRLLTEGYKVAHVNFENYKEATMLSFLNEFHARLEDGWGINFTNKDLQETFSAISRIQDQKLVLIIDEVEGINPDFFGQFLHSIYANRMGLTTATYLVFVDSEVTHKDVIEATDFIEDKNVLVTTYLIPYDLETDF